jgi:TPR repeat protein
VAPDSVQAVKWFSKSAAQGFAAAQNSLGEAHQYERGIQKDMDEALMLYRRAAAQG